MENMFDKPVSNNEPGVLAKLWRKIVTENNLIHVLPILINKYLESDKLNTRVKNLKKKNRSTMIDNITAGEMSIKVFLYLIFKLLRVTKIDITITLTFPQGRTSSHNVTVDGSFSSELEELDALELKDSKECKK